MPIDSLLALAPLPHGGAWTWDEYLLLILGLAIVVLVLLLGRQRLSDSGEGEGASSVLAAPPVARSHAEWQAQRAPADRPQPAVITGPLPPPAARKKARDLESNHPAIAIAGVSHRYGRTWALRNVSLAVPPSACYCLFGPNGAGKSTLLSILATLLEPLHGEVTLAGVDVLAEPMLVRRLVGRVGHKPLLYMNLTVLENLDFFGRLYHVAQQQARAEYLLERLGMWHLRHRPVRTLSHGQLRRASIARAVMHDPPVLLLDEPYAGLDLAAADRLDDLLEDLQDQGHTLFMASHNFERALERADLLGIMRQGRLRFESQTRAVTRASLRAIYHDIFADEERVHARA